MSETVHLTTIKCLLEGGRCIISSQLIHELLYVTLSLEVRNRIHSLIFSCGRNTVILKYDFLGPYGPNPNLYLFPDKKGLPLVSIQDCVKIYTYPKVDGSIYVTGIIYDRNGYDLMLEKFIIRMFNGQYWFNDRKESRTTDMIVKEGTTFNIHTKRISIIRPCLSLYKLVLNML